ELRRGPNPHVFDGRRERERPSIGEAVEDRAQPEPVIPVTVRDVHGREVLSVSVYPLDQVVGLADGQERIDEDCVALARDQRGRYRRPGPLPLAGSQVAGGQRLTWRDIHIPTQ